MVALQIRDVPDDVRDALAAEARTRGKSLQGLLLELVTTEARRTRNLAVLEQFEGRGDGTCLSEDELIEAVEAARAERAAGNHG